MLRRMGRVECYGLEEATDLSLLWSVETVRRHHHVVGCAGVETLGVLSGNDEYLVTEWWNQAVR